MDTHQSLESTNRGKQLQTLFKENLYLAAALAICAPLYLANAFKHSVPMGYAGLFTQMAQQVAEQNFQLPMESPFYGPGGIPFAYPPFGIFLLAVLIKVTGKYFIFLRLLPPLIGLFSFVPLYFLTLEVSKSRLAAMITVIIAACSPDIYTGHAWAAGIVRAPAFLFALFSIYFFSRQLGKRSRFNLIMAGVFLGLVCMSHLTYALFCFLWIWWWSIFNKDRIQTFKDALAISITGFLVASIYLIPVWSRYGLDVFFNAFRSHGGESLLSIWLTPRLFLDVFLASIEPITSNLVLSLLVLAGVIFMALRKNFIFLSFYVFIALTFPENTKFVYLLGSMAAGIGLSAFRDLISARMTTPARSTVLAGLLVFVLGFLWWESFRTISRQLPLLNNDMFDLAEQVQGTMKPGETYLALVRQDEAEWLPFLLQREPVVAQWGSEWLGEYNQQTYLMSLFRDCQRMEDWLCVEKAASENNLKMDYVISYERDQLLNDGISSNHTWEELFANQRYIVWKKTQ
jgi:hypothetical protein